MTTSRIITFGRWGGGSYFLHIFHVKQQQRHNKTDLYHSHINCYKTSMLFQTPLQTPEGSVFLCSQTPTLNGAHSFATKLFIPRFVQAFLQHI